MKVVPLQTEVSVTSTGATAFSVGEGQLKSISRLTLSDGQLDPQKAVAILVITDALFRMGGALAANLFQEELSNAIGVETDRAFLASITSGITPIASSGVTAAAIIADIEAALSQLTTNARSQVFLVVPPEVAKYWATTLNGTTGAYPTLSYKGGSIFGYDVVVTDVATNTLTAFDATQIAANGGTIELDASKEATVQLSDTPDSPPTASTNVQSFFQLNLVGLRATRTWGAERLGSRSVATISNVADSPA
jgi:hypothetical protein